MMVSVVTPVLNEERNLRSRARELAGQEGPWEWIVADGGSEDASAAVAHELGATVVRAARGRGPQLNAGAARARGDAVLFLHADTSLPSGALTAIRAAFAERETLGGNFTFAFDDSTWTAGLLARVYDLKQRLLGIWYGDSGMFVRRDVFGALGGFADVPIMEDLLFVERLRRAGKTRRLPLLISASPRRYQGRVWLTIARWTIVLILYKLGISPHTLAALYPGHRDR